MSFSKGDKVYVNCSGKCYGYDGTVIGQDAKGDYIVAFGWDTPEPVYEIFAEDALIPSLVNLKEEKVSEIKDTGERTEKPQENNGVNIWIKNAFGMGIIIVEAIDGDVHLFMENQKQDCTIVGQI